MSSPKQNLLDLPLTVFRLILDLFDGNDLKSFRLVSQTCNYLSEPIAFRKIVLKSSLSRGENIITAVNHSICNRLCDPNDPLSKYVRHLQVGPFAEEAHCPSEQVLINVLDRLEDLLDFSWDPERSWKRDLGFCNCSMPEGLLTTLSTKWPTVRLHAKVERDGTDVHFPTLLDTKLLSSPLLYSLNYSVIAKQNLEGEIVFWSRLSSLKQCLLQAKGLKRLRFDVGEECEVYSEEHGPRNLNFKEGDVFPALEELAFEYDGYELTELHCNQWATAMDWSHLRRLDLDCGCPQYLISALTGQIPQLKALKFGFFPEEIRTFSGEPRWDCPDLAVLQRFLCCINGLEEVTITSQALGAGVDFADIRDVLLDTHGRTLKTLHVQYYASQFMGWDSETVQKIGEQCTVLRDLSMKVAMAPSTTTDTQTTQLRDMVWPEHTMYELQKLRKLNVLAIFVHFDSDCIEFFNGPIGKDSFIHEAAQHRVVSLFKQLRGNNTHPSFESLTVKFTIGRDSLFGWWYRAKRHVGCESGILVEKTWDGFRYIEDARKWLRSWQPVA